MALLRDFNAVTKESQGPHAVVECGYSTFSAGGETYLQLDTYGSPERSIPGKISQSIQLDRDSAAKLKQILARTFPGV